MKNPTHPSVYIYEYIYNFRTIAKYSYFYELNFNKSNTIIKLTENLIPLPYNPYY